MIFYPLSGFIADVCCGRLKIVVVSLVILLFCLIILLIALQLRETKVAPSFDSDHVFSYKQGVSVIISAFLSLYLPSLLAWQDISQLYSVRIGPTL